MAVFIRLLSFNNKEASLQNAIVSPGEETYIADPSFFRKIPVTPFAYWIAEDIRNLFTDYEQYENLNDGRAVRCGLGTLDNFRFTRAFWEVAKDHDDWPAFYSGGKFSTFYDDFRLRLCWSESGHELKSFIEQKVGSVSRKVQGQEFYFLPGVTFPKRTRAFCPKFMPSEGIFSDGSQAGFAPTTDLPAVIAILSSEFCTRLIALSQGRTGNAAQYQVGLIQRLPWMNITNFKAELTYSSLRIWTLKRMLRAHPETSARTGGVFGCMV